MLIRASLIIGGLLLAAPAFSQVEVPRSGEITRVAPIQVQPIAPIQLQSTQNIAAPAAGAGGGPPPDIGAEGHPEPPHSDCNDPCVMDYQKNECHCPQD